MSGPRNTAAAPVVAVLDNDCATLSELRAHPENLDVLDIRDLRAAQPGETMRSGSHALACAALIGGRKGAAPRTPLLIGGVAARARLQADFIRWAAGLPLAADSDARLGPPPVRPADVISISLYLSDEAELVAALGDAARWGRKGLGTVITLAACNFTQPRAQPIARHGCCLTIGASCFDEDGREIVAPYSNRGIDVDFYVPSGASLDRRRVAAGDKILAAALPFAGQSEWEPDPLLRPTAGILPPELEGYYCLLAGTSTSAAVCAGVVAAMLRVNSRLTARQVKDLLAKTAVALESGTGSGETKFWRVDPAGAVAAAAAVVAERPQLRVMRRSKANRCDRSIRGFRAQNARDLR